MRIGILKFHTFSSPYVCYVCILSYAISFWLYFLHLPYLRVWWCFLLLVCWSKFYPAFFFYMPKLFISITYYMFHIQSVAINSFVTKHIAIKTILLKVPGNWWYFSVTVLNHSTSASGCNLSKMMTSKTFNIIHQRKEPIITSIITSKWFSVNTFLHWLLMGSNPYLLVDHFSICIRVPCLILWDGFTFNNFMKAKTFW